MISRRLAVKVGISYGTGAMNFGNDALVFERELRKFPQDTSFDDLKTAVEAADLEAARNAACALSETSSKLALSKLYSSLVPILQAIEDEALPAVEELEEVAAQRKRICDFLASV